MDYQTQNQAIQDQLTQFQVANPNVSRAITAVQLKPTDRVLEVGTGSGHQTAILAQLAKDVYTIEIQPSRSDQTEENLTSMGYQNIQFFVGDGMVGISADAPFDVIIVRTPTNEAPNVLIDQLNVGGRMIVRKNVDDDERFTYIVKHENGFSTEEIPPVPLASQIFQH